jgi:hypothetical protein
VIYLVFAILPCNFHRIPPAFRHVSSSSHYMVVEDEITAGIT